jgi:hypothetical protein
MAGVGFELESVGARLIRLAGTIGMLVVGYALGIMD